MIYLIISISCSVAVSILLKILRQRDIDIAQAVLVNYPIAATLTWLIAKPDLSHTAHYLQQWPLFIALGILLPSIFLVLGKSIAASGIVKTDAAQRLSLFISAIAAFTLFHDKLSNPKIISIALALIALMLLSAKSDDSSKNSTRWLLGVWFGYASIDILMKQLSKQGISTYPILSIAFILAAILMLLYLIIRRTRFTPTALASGLLLGALNFGNIYTYIRAHQSLAPNTATVYTTMNIGVIVLATLIGALAFRERLNHYNIAGIFIAIIGIAIMYFGRF